MADIDTLDAQWEQLRRQAVTCENCSLYERATQTVFGDGVRSARVVVVGEQPGNEEDLAGLPFVGPAGRLLDRALVDAGIDRTNLYITNAVKHFKWVPRGKLRLHQTPNQTEVVACRPWLEAEIALLDPVGIVALGATAGKALLGPQLRVTRDRGQMMPATVGVWSGPVLVTVHPSSLLRLRDAAEREAEVEHFAADLRLMLPWTGGPAS